MRELIGNVVTGVVVLCTMTMTGLAIKNQLQPKQASGRPRGAEQVQVEDWQKIANVGHRIGPPTAAVSVVVFSDFECPVCAKFANSLFPEIQSRHPGDVAMVFRHWPLGNHRFAYPTARAAECAGSQGRFKAFHDVVFAQQDKLGLKTHRQFAQEAGVADLNAFDACAAVETPVASIDKDIDEAKRLGGTGTPTVLVNGTLFIGGVNAAMLDSAVTKAIAASKSSH